MAAQQYPTPEHPITARDLAARIQIGGTVRGYGQYMSPEERSAMDEKEWAETLDHIYAGEKITGAVRVMHTPLVMQMVGARDLPVYIGISKVMKVKKDHPEMTAEVMKQLPRALADPIMITRSVTKKGRLVAVLALKGENGSNVVVPFELNGEEGRISANIITSAYPKGDRETNYSWMRKQVSKENLVYIDRTRASEIFGMNKKRTAALLKSAGVQFPLESNKRSGSLIKKVPDEEDLAKYKNARPSYYQMAGERAETAPLARLEEAKAMQASGESENAIWKKTGWMMGKDGKWRWEIPDNLDGIHLEPLKSEEHSLFGPEWKTAYLGEIYDNPKLYEAYPWMKYLEVSSGDIGQETHYGYTEMGRRAHLNRITLNANIMRDTVLRRLRR